VLNVRAVGRGSVATAGWARVIIVFDALWGIAVVKAARSAPVDALEVAGR
jgi:hypothetical protein